MKKYIIYSVIVSLLMQTLQNVAFANRTEGIARENSLLARAALNKVKRDLQSLDSQLAMLEERLNKNAEATLETVSLGAATIGLISSGFSAALFYRGSLSTQGVGAALATLGFISTGVSAAAKMFKQGSKFNTMSMNELTKDLDNAKKALMELSLLSEDLNDKRADKLLIEFTQLEKLVKQFAENNSSKMGGAVALCFGRIAVAALSMLSAGDVTTVRITNDPSVPGLLAANATLNALAIVSHFMDGGTDKNKEEVLQSLNLARLSIKNTISSF